MTLLQSICAKPQTGKSLRERLGGESAAFNRACEELWSKGLLRGRTEDGCCGDPCSMNCVTAFAQNMVWQPTPAGVALTSMGDRK